MAITLKDIIRQELDELAALKTSVTVAHTAELQRLDTRIAELTAAADLIKRDLTVEPIVTSLVELKAKRG